jgi:hypothetical protein
LIVYSFTPFLTFLAWQRARVFQALRDCLRLHKDFEARRTFFRGASALKHTKTMSRQSNNQKRGRSLNLQPSYVTDGYEVEIEEIKSDSEYDSDVTVIGRGRKAPRVSRTPPHHGPSALRMLPAPPSSPLLQPSTPAPEPACLEWYPTLSQHQCSHEAEVQQLRVQVGELQLEAQRNIELRTELRQDYCRMSSGFEELRELFKNLVDQRNWDDLRRQCDEEDRKEWENKIATRITFSEAKASGKKNWIRMPRQ